MQGDWIGMPKRVTSRRIETLELQGEGSFIVLRMMPYGIAKQARQFVGIGDVKNRTDMTLEQKQEWIAKETALTEKLIFGSIVDWNWVGDDDQPLPIPKTGDDLERLTSEEVLFILNHVQGLGKEAQKN